MIFQINSSQIQIGPASVLSEFKKLGKNHRDFKHIQKLSKESKNEGMDFLKTVIKAYTSEAVFKQIGQLMVNGNFN